VFKILLGWNGPPGVPVPKPVQSGLNKDFGLAKLDLMKLATKPFALENRPKKETAILKNAHKV
jgi:hypothetical protein